MDRECVSVLMLAYLRLYGTADARLTASTKPGNVAPRHHDKTINVQEDIVATRTARTAKPAPVQEPVEDEFEDMEELTEDEESATEVEIDDEDDDDLEELEEVEEDEAPVTPTKTKATKAKAEKTVKTSTIEFGSPWLAEHINSVVPGEKYDARSVRMLLRKLAKDGKLSREIGVERARYSFTGPEDATVKAVVAMVKTGEAKALKQAGLQAVREKADAKKAAAKAAEAEAIEDEDVEEVEEAPKPRRTTRKATATPAKAAPAKAAPAKATTTRRASAK